MLHQRPNHRLEFAVMAARPSLLVQEFQAYLPFILLAAVLARQLIDTPVDGLSQPEVVAAQRKHLRALNNPVNPVGQPYFELTHAPRPCFPYYPPTLDQAKAFGHYLSIGLDVGRDARSAQAFQRLLQAAVAVPARLSIGPDQEFMGIQVECLGERLARVLLGHDLGDAVDENV